MVWYGVAGRVYSYVKIVHNRNTGLQKYAKHPRLKTDSESRTRIKQHCSCCSELYIGEPTKRFVILKT